MGFGEGCVEETKLASRNCQLVAISRMDIMRADAKGLKDHMAQLG